jgi:hypothetical protein
MAVTAASASKGRVEVRVFVVDGNDHGVVALDVEFFFGGWRLLHAAQERLGLVALRAAAHAVLQLCSCWKKLARASAAASLRERAV